APLWRLTHEPGPVGAMVHTRSFVAYPMLPWLGVMACGYAFGSLLIDRGQRTRRCVRLGLGLVALFVVVRAANLYGDPERWSAQPRGAIYTLISFLDCTTYPPSLYYLLLTL